MADQRIWDCCEQIIGISILFKPVSKVYRGSTGQPVSHDRAVSTLFLPVRRCVACRVQAWISIGSFQGLQAEFALVDSAGGDYDAFKSTHTRDLQLQCMPDHLCIVQAGGEWPDNRGGALPGSMMMDSNARLMKGMLEMPGAGCLPAVLDPAAPAALSSSAMPLEHSRSQSVPLLSPSSAAVPASMAEAASVHDFMPATPAADSNLGLEGSQLSSGSSPSSRGSPRSKSLPVTSRVCFSQVVSIRHQDVSGRSETVEHTSMPKQLDSGFTSQKHHTSPAAFAASMPAQADNSSNAELAHDQSGQAVDRRSKSLAGSIGPKMLQKMRASTSQPLLRNALRSSGPEPHTFDAGWVQSSPPQASPTPARQRPTGKEQDAIDEADGLSMQGNISKSACLSRVRAIPLQMNFSPGIAIQSKESIHRAEGRAHENPATQMLTLFETIAVLEASSQNKACNLKDEMLDPVRMDSHHQQAGSCSPALTGSSAAESLNRW